MNSNTEHESLVSEILSLAKSERIKRLVINYKITTQELIFIRDGLIKVKEMKEKIQRIKQSRKRSLDPCRSSTNTNG